MAHREVPNENQCRSACHDTCAVAGHIGSVVLRSEHISQRTGLSLGLRWGRGSGHVLPQETLMIMLAC